MNANSTNSRFSLFDELDRGLNHIVNEVLQADSTKRDVPALSVYELDDRYVVECDLPGLSIEDIELQLNDGVLEILGERKNPFPVSEGVNVTTNERVFSSFTRKLQLPKDVKHDGIDAELGNGVLKVTISKADSVMPRTVSIRKTDD